jgi:uncharacterized protein YjbI with pentapeptide repeats
MANPEHLAVLNEGIEAWNRWREDHPKTRPDLREASLHGAILSKAVLTAAVLNGADLIGANLIGASLHGANLIGANLIGANLNGVNLSWADLSNANFSETNLFHANLRRAKLDRADFTNARVGHTTFADVDLGTVIGLRTIEHSYPSTIGIDTIYKSKGKIPHAFLRGAGVPDVFITYMESLNSTGIEFYSLFISYSTRDQEFAERLHADLQANGVRCWFAPLKLRGGNWLDEQLEGAIREYDKLLLIVSEASMASDWVKWEVSNALSREEKEGKRVLFPIRLCSYEKLDEWKCPGRFPGSDLAPAVRRYFIPDFSNWTNPAAYSKAFDRLLKDLHGKAGPATAQSEVP